MTDFARGTCGAVTETDLGLGDGRALHVYDTGADGADGRHAVFWHRGTPNIGTLPEPLFAAASRLGTRWVSYDRPGYGGSTPHPGRDIASAAHVSAIADTLSIDRGRRYRTGASRASENGEKAKFAELPFYALG